MAQILYHYDADNQVTAVEVDGEVRELSPEDRRAIPAKNMSLSEFSDLNTSIRSTVESIKDSYKGGAIIVDIEATHGGYFNLNGFNYKAAGMKKHVKTWTEPFGRPYLVNHDMSSEPRGRVVKAKFVSTGNDTGYHALDTRIAHPEEIEMVIDARALTVSVGSKPLDTVECSFCGHDLYHGGNTPKRVEIDKAPDKSWLSAKAPGVYGMFGLTNEDLWDYKGDDDNHSIMCRHIRQMDAPVGGKDFEKIGWFLHGQNYREVSRVNLPADQNHATGEFAHIRGVLEQTDGLDADTAYRVLVDELSRVERGVVDRSRFQVVSEKDLFRPTTTQEACDYATRTNLTTMFDTGLWLAVTAKMQDAPQEAQIETYHAAGGRFVATDTTVRMSAKEALQNLKPEDFIRWLAAQDDLTREEKRQLDVLYARRLIRRNA